MKEHYVYQHRDLDSHVFYVGCATTNPEKRGIRAKLQRAYSTSGHSKAWQDAAINGYVVEVLAERYMDRNEAFEKERELIAMYRLSGYPLVNMSDGGAGNVGLKDKPETRRKKSVTKIGALNPMHGKTGAAHPTSRKVHDKISGATYDSVLIASTTHGHKMKTLYNWLSGHRPNPTTLEFA